jgi:hypothetical protein
MMKSRIHQKSGSRISDNGRLYWKETKVFLWKKGYGRKRGETQSIHTFYMPEWIDRFEIITKVLSGIRQNS